MVNRELDCIDFCDHAARRQVDDNAQSPVPGAPISHAAPAETFVMPSQPPHPSGRPRKNPERPAGRQQRSDVRVTIQQRKNHLAAFRKNHATLFQHLVRREIELDAAVPTRVVRSDPEAIVERLGGTSRRSDRKSSTSPGGSPKSPCFFMVSNHVLFV